MKFERRFPRRQSLKWTSFYLDYRKLKTLSKAACIGAHVDWQEVFSAFNRELDKEEQLYIHRLQVISRQRTELYDQHHIAQNCVQGAFSLPTREEDLEVLRKPLLQISADLAEIQQFGALNKEAVLRILSKVSRSSEKNVPEAIKCRYKTDQSAFVHQTQLSANLQVVDGTIKWILSSCPKQEQQPHDSALALSSCESQKAVPRFSITIGLNVFEWGLPSEVAKSPDTALLRDGEGNTPLHLAVIAGSAASTRSLLGLYSQWRPASNDTGADDKLQSVLVELLPLVVRSRQQDVVRLLLRRGVNVNHRTMSGETAFTLFSAEAAKTTLEICETSRRWTPLFIACVEGHSSIAQLLLNAGADPLQLDRFGWTAKEHAAYRGHLSLAKLLVAPVIFTSLSSPDPAMACRRPPFLARGQEIDLSLSPDWDRSGSRSGEMTHILVTLGSPNTRDSGEAVVLHAGVGIRVSSDAAYTIEIHALAAVASNDAKGRLQLPVVEDLINKPWHFTTEDPEHVKIVFTIFTSNGQSDGQILVGRAVTLLQNLKHSLAKNREGLARKYVPQAAKRGFWGEGGLTQVVGHRGSGANSATHTNLQLGENTIQSYLSAVKLGASAVEFDVQLTKDLVPVIFHDFLVMESGSDTPVYTLRLDQFQHLSEAQVPKSDLPSMAESRYRERNSELNDLHPKLRSKSLDEYDRSRYLDLVDRMRYTESVMAGDYKGNLRGNSVQGVFPTFEKMFIDLPETTAFNVEMKYPMLWEAEDRNMDCFAPEINAYVDIVLSTIDRLAGKRSITFSSFSPEVCILLTLKQRDYPILFLSKAGSIPVGDVRCSGLQQSIRFAQSWSLAGIVMLSDPLVMCPRLIKYAESSGLRIQADGGLDVIIVDKVKLISTTLSGNYP
ncbi:MAG: hypothetical protein Q9170_005775 [Blastenia crenularia]